MKMSRFIKLGLSPFVYSNIFVAFCTAAYTAKTSLLLFGDNGSTRVNSLVFCVTLFFYCFHRMNKQRSFTPDESLEARNSWMNKHKRIYSVLIGISLAIVTLQLFHMPIRTWLVFIPVALLGAGYTFPLIPTHNGWKRLRDIYWLKTFWIAFAFSCLTTFLPVIFVDPVSALFQPEVLFIFIRAFLFLFAICIPFDIRDMVFDRKKGVITLPVRFGAPASVNIAIGLLLLFIFLIGIDFRYFHIDLKPAFALFLSAVLTIVLLPLSKNKQYALLFPLLYDSALLIQWIFIFAMIRI
jgi:4-hydroxybenzoate polyprenyltransferase